MPICMPQRILAKVKIAGKVIKLLSANLAQVQITRKEACGSCSSCGMGKVEDNIVEASNQIGAVEGNQVELEVASSNIVKGSLLVFILPLAMLFLGYLIGSVAGKLLVGSEVAGIVGAAVFFLGGLLLTKHFDYPAKRLGIVGVL